MCRGCSCQDGSILKDDFEEAGNASWVGEAERRTTHAEDELRGLMYWRATASVGEPLAIATANADGLSLSVFQDETGAIRGVLVTEEDDLVAAVGFIPTAVLQEERHYLGREPLTLPEWAPVELLGDV